MNDIILQGYGSSALIITQGYFLGQIIIPVVGRGTSEVLRNTGVSEVLRNTGVSEVLRNTGVLEVL